MNEPLAAHLKNAEVDSRSTSGSIKFLEIDLACLSLSIEYLRYHLAHDIIDFQRGPAILTNSEFNGGSWVERIRVILVEHKFRRSSFHRTG